MTVRDVVMKSLMAIGSAKEAAFYTKIFLQQQTERFALIVIDPRCLKNPLLDVLVGDLKVLYDLKLTPILLIGGLDENRSSVRFQAQRLCKALDGVGIANSKLNCASYEFMRGVKKIAKSGRFPVLEMTELQQRSATGCADVKSLALRLKPFKVIFLQPSGGFRVNGQRLPVVNIDKIDSHLDMTQLSGGQNQFVKMVKALAMDTDHHCTYVIASPLNLLAELFTVKGAGTMLRRGANIVCAADYKKFNKPKLKKSIEGAFEQSLVGGYFKRPTTFVCAEENYRGGAIVTQLAGLPYLSKFWVEHEAQGEGIARDIWQSFEKNTQEFFWRSKNSNPFNHWYMKMCDGMQVSGAWRVFWKGLKASEIPTAILAASNALIDFEEE